MNTLYYGDNLEILRQYIKDESVDLVYLDPPFNSDQEYNMLFAEQDGTRSAAQIKALKDTWRRDEGSARTHQEVVETGSEQVSKALQSRVARRTRSLRSSAVLRPPTWHHVWILISLFMFLR
jgi:DNA modification methylase